MTAPAAIWLVLGLALCVAEAVHPGLFLLWVGLAACGVGAVAWLWDPGLVGQVVAFLVLAGVLVALAARRPRHRRGDAVNAPGVDLIGRPCRALAFEGAEGRVAFRDGAWPARTVDGSTPAPDAAMRVVGLDGLTLLIE